MPFARTPNLAVRLSTAVSLLAFQAAPALAFDPSGNDVADAFLTLLEADKGTVESYGSVDTSGDDVTITDLVLTNEDKKDSKVTIGSSVLSDGEVLDSGRLQLSSLELQKLTLAADDGGLSLANLKVTGLLLPTPEEVAAKTGPVGPAYKTLEVNKVQIRKENGKVADIEKIASSIDALDGGLPTSGKFAITGAALEVKQLDSKEGKSLSQLGYDTLTLNVSGALNWDPETAKFNVPELKVDAEDAASLSVSLSLGGVTRDVIAKLNKKTNNPEEAMALLQNVTIETAKIRLDDASLTGRILDKEAQNAGVETSDYVSRLTGSLPMMLGMLQNKELEAKVSTAVTEYLTTPGSLEVTATPGVPVPIAQIVGTAMLAPQMIPQILSVGITANQ
ncbi:hypothetical protein [Roseibium aggregatum]|uniref:Uncharacterized protein n=1 Tax=Roseibium aggregatum TaxID=187304 RepID=A0A939EC77_9HYPH|nr:hypothetical protein [Roseibium aggregatum]MBN9670071.1 hypothetical protein [Roseibium aggregatum]